jgi:hypothetical protein
MEAASEVGQRRTADAEEVSRLLTRTPGPWYNRTMILIRFPNIDAKRAALGRLAGRFSFTSRATGEMLVPEDALPYLAVEGIVFTVEGPATYEQSRPALRGSSAASA